MIKMGGFILCQTVSQLYVYNITQANIQPELIEACGDKLDYLKKNTKVFTAHGYWEQNGVHHCLFGEGIDCADAVARLWLAINKK